MVDREVMMRLLIFRFPAGFVPTSNGLISPGLPTFNRPNNNGVPPNMARSEIVYPIQYLQPNAGRQHGYQGNMGPPAAQIHAPASYPHQATQQQQFYATAPAAASVSASVSYNNRKLQCTNCGLTNHTRNECPEPSDISSSMSE